MHRTLAASAATAAVLLVTPLGGSSTVLAHAGGRALHVTKECSQYTGAAGDFCTITSSNVPGIKVGMKVVYANGIDPVAGTLDSNVVVSFQHGQAAHGHVTLDLATLTGRVTFDGGTGKFRDFHASAAVACADLANCAWDGTFSFGERNDDCRRRCGCISVNTDAVVTD